MVKKRVIGAEDGQQENALSIYKTPKYTIQKIADKFQNDDGHIKVLFLPVAHPELNPIEMVWSCIKRNAASRNMNFSLTEVEEATKEEVIRVTEGEFAKYYGHVLKEEAKYRILWEEWEHTTEDDDSQEIDTSEGVERETV